MPERAAVIDLHCHLLPAVDDGSRSVDQSVRVLAHFAASGITDVCLTPHLLASQASAGIPESHDRAFQRLTAAAGDAVRLHRGAEVMLDRPLPPRAAENPAIRLAGTRYILVEFPRLVTAETVATALTHVVKLGLRPLLAHPERYSSCSVGAAQRWKAAGAVLQLDATTLLASRRAASEPVRCWPPGSAISWRATITETTARSLPFATRWPARAPRSRPRSWPSEIPGPFWRIARSSQSSRPRSSSPSGAGFAASSIRPMDDPVRVIDFG